MKNIVILIPNNDINEETIITDFKTNIVDTFNILLQDLNISSANLNNELFANCAGYILEQYIKTNLQNITSFDIKKHFKFTPDKWYDFKYDNNKVKLLTFKEGEELSDTVLSSYQYDDRKNMIFLSIIYNINNSIITISDIIVTLGSNIKTSYDKVYYNSLKTSNLIPNVVKLINLLTMKYTSNLAGDVQILNL